MITDDQMSLIDLHIGFIMRNIFDKDVKLVVNDDTIFIHYPGYCLDVTSSNAKYQMIGCCCEASVQNLLYEILDNGGTFILESQN